MVAPLPLAASGSGQALWIRAWLCTWAVVGRGLVGVTTSVPPPHVLLEKSGPICPWMDAAAAMTGIALGHRKWKGVCKKPQPNQSSASDENDESSSSPFTLASAILPILQPHPPGVAHSSQNSHLGSQLLPSVPLRCPATGVSRKPFRERRSKVGTLPGQGGASLLQRGNELNKANTHS